MELRIDLQDEQENKVTWVYQQFSVDGMAGGQSLNNMYFSTFDHDNDENGGNCAATYKGVWWHRSCYTANLNNPHAGNSAVNRITWYDGSKWVYYPSVEMKVRPKTCEHRQPQQCNQ